MLIRLVVCVVVAGILLCSGTAITRPAWIRCYWRGDFVQMEGFALKSRENGDYLFNNYLLYIAAVKGGNTAMASHYKNEIATRFSDKMHRSIYAEMFAELQL